MTSRAMEIRIRNVERRQNLFAANCRFKGNNFRRRNIKNQPRKVLKHPEVLMEKKRKDLAQRIGH